MALSSSKAGSDIKFSCSLCVEKLYCASVLQLRKSVCSITVISLESSDVFISITSISSILSEGSLEVLTSNSKFESGNPSEPSVDEIKNGRSVRHLTFWLGRLRCLRDFLLLYILVVEVEVADEEVGDEVDAALGPFDTVVVGPVCGSGWELVWVVGGTTLGCNSVWAENLLFGCCFGPSLS